MSIKYICDVTGEEIVAPEGDDDFVENYQFFFPAIERTLAGKMTLATEDDSVVEFHLGAKGREQVAKALWNLFGDDIAFDPGDEDE